MNTYTNNDTMTFEHKIKDLELGELGHYIKSCCDDFRKDQYIISVFSRIAEEHTDWDPIDLLDWTKDHVAEVDHEITTGSAINLLANITYAQVEYYKDDLYTHKDDILLYYACNYIIKNKLNLLPEDLQALEEYIKSLNVCKSTLRDIEEFCRVESGEEVIPLF